MGIGKSTLKIFEKLFREGFFNEINSVMEIGSQEITVEDKEDLLNILIDVRFAKNLYALLGIKEYECIDSDGKFGAHIFDLNKEIDKEYDYKKQFDLVTNHGTTEHVFNQYSCFKNIHNLTKVGGYMFHGVPFIGCINHCFYMYQCLFFKNLARDNNYEIKGMWIGKPQADIVPYSDENYEKYRKEGKVLIFCLLKKTTENPFKTPFQGEYIKASKLK